MRQKIIPEVVARDNTIIVNETSTLHEALHIMEAHHIDAVCVSDAHDHLVGIVCVQDAIHHLMNHDLPARTIPLREIMTPNPETLHEDDDVLDAMELMVNRKVRHLPVCTHDNAVIAMVSMGDLLKSALKMLNEESQRARDKAFAPEDK